MRTVKVIGGDLFRYALLYLGDSLQWNRIAQANGLIDPVLTGPVTLNIPAPSSSFAGGVYGNS